MHRFIWAAYRFGIPAITGMQYAAMRRHRLIVAVSATMLIVLSAFTSATAADRSPLVVVSTAQTGTVIKQVPLTGTITSARVAKVSAEVSGQVEAVKVEVGDHVESGTALVELDREIEQLTLGHCGLQPGRPAPNSLMQSAATRMQSACANRTVSPRTSYACSKRKLKSMAPRSNRKRPRKIASRRAWSAIPCRLRSAV